MRELILTLGYWLHLISTVVWIGGIIFILFVAIPSSKQVMGAEAGKMMGEISKRFTPLANYSIIFLVVTGIILTGLGNDWTLVMILKHTIVLVMIVIHFYRGLLLMPKIGRTESSTVKKSLQKLSLNLVKVNFSIGILVLLLSAISSVV